MALRPLFVTRLYEDALGDGALVAALAEACRELAREDRAGRAWAKANGYPGYTSYATLTDLHRRDPRFGDLARALDAHVRRFCAGAFLDLGGRRPKLDGMWANVMRGGGHSGHLHPHSIVSGTLYLAVPAGAAGLRLEDPRLAAMMAAPPRAADAPESERSFVYLAPAPGTVLLWESWLRHEVPPGPRAAERISVSFNYRW